jgi:hypothetical protein
MLRLDTANEQRAMPAEIGDLKDQCPLCKVITNVVTSASRTLGDDIQEAPHGPWFTIRAKVSETDDLGTPVLQIWTPEPGNRSYQHTSSAKLTPLSIDADPMQETIQYERLTAFLSNCIDDHALCRQTDYVESSPAVRVIDCKLRKLISPGTEPYLTLSYVWGPETPEGSCTDKSSYFPATIEDAMSVTVALGYKNLWVDRFCIDQKNNAEVLQQISVMDAIYQRSSLTIIAACGHDAEYGLPGVGKRKRMKCFESRSQRHCIREVVNGRRLISSSRWNERGWTYQEGLFAQRQLVFTDYGVYFECAEDNAWELDPVRTQKQTRIYISHQH